MICPNCNNLKTEYFFETKNTHGSKELSKEKFVILKCSLCGSIFPRIDLENQTLLKSFYPHNYYKKNNFPTSFINQIYKIIYLSWLRFLVNRFLRGEKILDFGCGQGEFLASFPKRIQKYGIELNDDTILYIRKNFPEISISQDLTSLESNKHKFDVITLWHVLEHIKNPKYIVLKLTKLLKKGGHLIISTPNTDSFGMQITKSNWFHIDTPRHLIIFNTQNLTEIIRKAKLKILEVRGNWIEYPLDLYWSLYNHFKTSYLLLNFFLALFLLPISFMVKFVCLILPKKAEIITIICRKT